MKASCSDYWFLKMCKEDWDGRGEACFAFTGNGYPFCGPVDLKRNKLFLPKSFVFFNLVKKNVRK